MEYREEERLTVLQLTPYHVHALWDWLEPDVRRVLDKCGDDYKAPDVYCSVWANKSTLFLVLVDNEYRGCFALQVDQVPMKGKTVLTCWFLCFVGAKAYRHELREHMKDLGRKIGCSKLQFKTPLRGWEREAPKEGFKLKLTIWETDLG